MPVGISPQPNVGAAPRDTGFGALFWLLAALTGLGSGLAAGLLMKLLRLVQHLAWSYPGGEPFLDAVETSSNLTRVLVLLGTGALVAIVMPLIGRIRSGPGDLEAAIWFDDGRLPLVKTVLKAVFSIVIVGAGRLARPRDGPQAGRHAGRRAARPSGAGSPPTQRRLLAACGAGAGIAAVYNVPFGGALFALEVLLGTLALPLVAPAFLATLTATATYWLFFPNEPTYHLGPMPLTAGLVVFAAVVGARRRGGLGAVRQAARRRRGAEAERLGRSGRRRCSCSACSAPSRSRIRSCSATARIPWSSPRSARSPCRRCSSCAILKPVMTAACLGTGAPGGLFTPTITFGALLGGAFGHVWLLAGRTPPPAPTR